MIVSTPWSVAWLHGESLFPLQHVREVAHLDLENGKSSAIAGIAKVFQEDEEILRFEGRDRKGKPWRLWVERLGGVGFTDVWTGDFDDNGQTDLLIAPFFPKNGHCVNGLELIILLFVTDGRPVPWTFHTELPNSKDPPYIPVLITDLNGDHRAEIVPIDCTYEGGADAKWKIAGIYEAQNSQWVPLRSADLKPYDRMANAAYASRRSRAQWSYMSPNEWSDPMSGMDSTAKMYLSAVLGADERCRGIRIPPIVNGRMVSNSNDPCHEFGANWIVYSDERPRLGWPNVVIDGPDGRDIYTIHPEKAIRRIIENKYPVKLLGSDIKPAWIWATSGGRP